MEGTLFCRYEFSLRTAGTKHRIDRRALLIRQQVPVAPDHILAQVTDPGIDHALIDALGGAIGAERMTKHVPAAEFLPLRAGERPLEMLLLELPVEAVDS